VVSISILNDCKENVRKVSHQNPQPVAITAVASMPTLIFSQSDPNAINLWIFFIVDENFNPRREIPVLFFTIFLA